MIISCTVLLCILSALLIDSVPDYKAPIPKAKPELTREEKMIALLGKDEYATIFSYVHRCLKHGWEPTLLEMEGPRQQFLKAFKEIPWQI